MERGKPDDPPLDAPARLEAARGHFRDAVGSVQNLAQLLHSVRVGPRAIESVLPDVRDSCVSLEQHARTLLEAVAVALPERSAVDELLSYLVPRAHELEKGLALALGKPVNAKARLGLEQAVTRLSRELDAGRSLVDLLDEAVRGGRVRVELAELLRHGRASREDGERIEARVASPLSAEALVNPRVCSLLLGIGARLVHALRGSAPQIRLEAGASGPRLLIEAAGDVGELVSLPTLPVVAPTLACAAAAARLGGAQLTWDDAVPRFSLDLHV